MGVYLAAAVARWAALCSYHSRGEGRDAPGAIYYWAGRVSDQLPSTRVGAANGRWEGKALYGAVGVEAMADDQDTAHQGVYG